MSPNGPCRTGPGPVAHCRTAPNRRCPLSPRGRLQRKPPGPSGAFSELWSRRGALFNLIRAANWQLNRTAMYRHVPPFAQTMVFYTQNKIPARTAMYRHLPPCTAKSLQSPPPCTAMYRRLPPCTAMSRRPPPCRHPLGGSHPASQSSLSFSTVRLRATRRPAGTDHVCPPPPPSKYKAP